MSGFYVPYMLALHEALDGKARITAITHRGNSSGRVFTLAEETEHKVSYLREHVLLPGQPPCILVGHSIGKYNWPTGLFSTTVQVLKLRRLTTYVHRILWRRMHRIFGRGLE